MIQSITKYSNIITLNDLKRTQKLFFKKWNNRRDTDREIEEEIQNKTKNSAE
jgi:hypothetical protein